VLKIATTEIKPDLGSRSLTKKYVRITTDQPITNKSYNNPNYNPTETCT